VIKEFLSESLLKTTHAVDALIEDLSSSNFFPTTKMTDVEEIARDEIKRLHEKSYPYLITQLVNARKSTNTTISSNSERFLVGLASLKSENTKEPLRKNAVVICCVDADNAAFIGRMISADGTLLDGLSAKDHSRICKLLVENAKTSKAGLTSKLSHPAKQMGSMASSLEESLILKKYIDFFDEILKRFPYEPVFFEALDGKDELAKKLVASWKKNAGSSTFDVSNKFAGAIQEIDQAVGRLINDEDTFQIAAAVKEAADWNAFTAKSLTKSKFSDAPNLSKAAQKYIFENEKEAEDFITSNSIADSLEDFVAAVFEA